MSLSRAVTQLKAEAQELRQAATGSEADLSPAGLMRAAGLEPDPWQARFFEADRQTLLLCTRQGGKSTAVAAKGLSVAMKRRRSLVLLLSPSLRQSQELFSKAKGLYRSAGRPVPAEQESALRIRFVHGSRIIALPGSEKTTRGYSDVDFLAVDEAARVDDELYFSVRPMLAVSGGTLVCMTTPFGKRGFFYDEWTDGGSGWHRERITAEDCPRITAEFLEEERRRLGPRWFRQEYFCQFNQLSGSLFRQEDIDAAFRDDFEPLFPQGDAGGLLTDDFDPIE